jgi:HNH endonuclease
MRKSQEILCKFMADARLSLQTKRLVKERANGCCEYCLSQSKFSSDPLSIEHIIPRSKGGTNDLEDLAVSCQGCNNLKYNHTEAIDPMTGEVAPLYHPRQDSWHEHFYWSADLSQMIGATPTGRATVEKLQLNREGVVNLRRLLVPTGDHPPKGFQERI